MVVSTSQRAKGVQRLRDFTSRLQAWAWLPMLLIQTRPKQTLLVKSQICRKQLGHAIFGTQKDRDLAPVKLALATVETPLPRLNQQSLF